MQESTGKFAEIRLTQNRLSYAESRTLMSPDEHILSDLKFVHIHASAGYAWYVVTHSYHTNRAREIQRLDSEYSSYSHGLPRACG